MDTIFPQKPYGKTKRYNYIYKPKPQGYKTKVKRIPTIEVEKKIKSDLIREQIRNNSQKAQRLFEELQKLPYEEVEARKELKMAIVQLGLQNQNLIDDINQIEHKEPPKKQYLKLKDWKGKSVRQHGLGFL